jgi:hypothetical protein
VRAAQDGGQDLLPSGRRVRLPPPQVLRVITAGHSACSPRHLVASSTFGETESAFVRVCVSRGAQSLNARARQSKRA